MSTKIQVVIWNENTVMAGRAVSQTEIDRHEDGADSWDFTKISGTAEELEAEAVWYEQNRGRFGARVAETIREALA